MLYRRNDGGTWPVDTTLPTAHHVVCHQQHYLSTHCGGKDHHGCLWSVPKWPNPAVLTDPPPEDTEVCPGYNSRSYRAYRTDSQYSHLIRITEWVLRFIFHCRKKGVEACPFLTTQELSDAETYQIKTYQRQIFAEEVSYFIVIS